MKKDINLLNRRKTKTYSNKKIAITIVLLLIVAAGLYAGITLPSSALKVLKIDAADLERRLSSSSANQQDLTNKTQQKVTLEMQLSELTALNDSKADVLKYIEAVESSQPSVTIIAQIIISDNNMDLMGLADSDTSIALFCLRLREQNIFESVNLTNSVTSTEDGITSFVINVTLPSSLNSVEIIQEIEKMDDVTKKDVATPEATVTEEAEKK